MGNEKENNAAGGVGKRFVHHTIAEPCPEEDLPGKLKIEMPPSRPLSRSLALEQILPAQSVKIEACEHHDRVVRVVLNLEEETSRSVKSHNAVVVGAFQAREEAMRDRKEWNMFDIGIMLRLVGHNVMNIMTSFPPAETKSTEKISDDHSNDSVNVEIVCDPHVTGIMSGENKLVPETAEEKRRARPPSHAEEHVGQACEECISTAFYSVTEVVAIVKALGLDALVQFAVLSFDLFLPRGIQGWIFGNVKVNLFLGSGI